MSGLGPPIQLTILRQGDMNVVDLAEVGSLIPRSETHVDDAFLRELAAEMRHLGGAPEHGIPGLDLQRIGSLIFSHLLPEPARARLRAAPPSDLHLRLDERLVDVPWELCHDGADFLAMRHRVGRQVITDRPIPPSRPVRGPEGALRVLVVADPTETLPRAAEEAERLCALLDAVPGMEVTLVGGRTVRRLPLLAALQAHEVVHFAGHSAYDAAAPARSGWRLADGVLTAGELSRLSPPPLLVFSNSCEAGATAEWTRASHYDGRAFGIGSAFLLAGVRSYVGTFWVLHDEESARFATVFYCRLAAGESLGAALLGARQTIARERERQGFTWASYLLYGDPTFVPLPAARPAAAPPPPAPAGAPPQATPPAWRFDVRVGGDAARAAPSVDRVAAPATRIVGRAAERAALHRALERGRGGRRAVAFVSGAPGIGKTALTDAFVDDIRAAGDVLVAHGQAVEHYGAAEPYLPVMEAWNQLGRGLVDRLRRHAPTWLAHLPGLVDPPEAEALQRRAQGATRERMLREMAELLEVVTAERPVVLVLEDLHWSDPSTLELVAYLARRREPARLLVLGTYRPLESMRGDQRVRAVLEDLVVRSHAEELRLEPLGEGEVRDYLRTRLGPVDPPAVRRIHERTEGHPLFLATVVDFALAQGLLVEGPGGWRLEGNLDAVPDSLRRMIDRQVEALRPEEQAALEAASVVGATFDVAAVAAALEADARAVDDRFEALAWRGQLVRANGLAEWPDGTVGGSYRFVHALYQNVIYERIAEARRVRMHRRIGERKAAAWGDRAADIAGELAAHFAAAREARRAIEHHVLAGDAAIQRHADREAAEHFTSGERLLPSIPPGPERTALELGLLVKLATPLMSTRGYAARDVERVFERAHALSRQVGGGPHQAPLLRGLVSFYQVSGDARRARDVGEELLALCAAGDDPIARVQADYGHGVTLYELGELEAAERHLGRALAAYDPDTHARHVELYGGYDPGAACPCWLAWISWLRGEPERAVRASEDGLALAVELGHPFSTTFARLALAIVRLQRGEVDAAVPVLDAAEATAREEGFAYHVALATGLRGWLLLQQGRPAEALAYLDEGIAGHDVTGARVGRPGFIGLRGFVKTLLGRAAEGVADLEAALADAERTGQRLHRGPLQRLRGLVLLLGAGDDDARAAEAEPWFRRALEAAEAIGARMPALQAAMSLAAVWVRQGRAEEGRALVAPRRAAITGGQGLPDVRAAERLLAQ